MEIKTADLLGPDLVLEPWTFVGGHDGTPSRYVAEIRSKDGKYHDWIAVMQYEVAENSGDALVALIEARCDFARQVYEDAKARHAT